MPAERVSMRQAREIIRLKYSTGMPTREVARRLGLARFPSVRAVWRRRMKGDSALVWLDDRVH